MTRIAALPVCRLEVVTLACIVMGLISVLFGCTKGTSKWSEGGLYYTANEDGTYSVLKILKLDGNGVHVRVYSNQFREPPIQVDESALYLAGMDRSPEETLGMGHLPLSHGSFEGWQARFIQQSVVKDEELDGYNTWLEAKGGYF